MKKVCFTGKRPQSMPWQYDESDARCVALKMRLEEEILQALADGYRWFITGMAQGADIWAGEILLRLKREQYPDIRLEAAIPYPAQADRWPESDRVRYRKVLDGCHKKTLCCPVYHRGCFHIRNRYMVDKSQRVIAVYDGSGGGTGYTIGYAEETQKDLRVIPIV